MTYRSKILDAIVEYDSRGETFTRDNIADMTGIDKKAVSTVLCDLRELEVITQVGKEPMKENGGNSCNIYALARR